MNKKENFTVTSSSPNSTSSSPNSTSATAVEEDVVSVLDAHIISEVDRRITILNNQTITDSIKNLGIIARKIQEDGDFTFPTNLNVTGDFHVSGDINLPINNKLLPQGCILMWGQEEIPQGWVLCDGSAYLRKKFLNEVSDELPLVFTNELILQLNEAVREKYIITPNLSGRFVLGAGQGSVEGMTNRTLDEFGPENGIEGVEGIIDTGVRNGGEVHKLTKEQLPEHTHSFKSGQFTTNGQCGAHSCNNAHGTGTTEENSGGGNEVHNNMPPYHVLKYIMKVY